MEPAFLEARRRLAHRFAERWARWEASGNPEAEALRAEAFAALDGALPRLPAAPGVADLDDLRTRLADIRLFFEALELRARWMAQIALARGPLLSWRRESEALLGRVDTLLAAAEPASIREARGLISGRLRTLDEGAKTIVERHAANHAAAEAALGSFVEARGLALQELADLDASVQNVRAIERVGLFVGLLATGGLGVIGALLGGRIEGTILGSIGGVATGVAAGLIGTARFRPRSPHIERARIADLRVELQAARTQIVEELKDLHLTATDMEATLRAYGTEPAERDWTALRRQVEDRSSDPGFDAAMARAERPMWSPFIGALAMLWLAGIVYVGLQTAPVPLPPPVDRNTWRGTLGLATIEGILRESDGSMTGTLEIAEGSDRWACRARGTISPERRVALTLDDCPARVAFEGTLAADGRSLTGSGRWSAPKSAMVDMWEMTRSD